MCAIDKPIYQFQWYGRYCIVTDTGTCVLFTHYLKFGNDELAIVYKIRHIIAVFEPR